MNISYFQEHFKDKFLICNKLVKTGNKEKVLLKEFLDETEVASTE